MAVELGVGYLTVLPSTRGFPGLLGKQVLPGMTDVGEKAGDEVGKGMSSRAKIVGAAAGVAIGLAVTKALVGAIDSQAATAKLGAQLGASAKDTKRYGKLAGRLYAQGYGEDLTGVNDAIGRVLKDIPGMDRATDRSLGAITKQVQSVASTFDQDLGGTTAAIGQLIRTGLVKDAQAGLDLVTKGLQGPANKSDDLLETFNEYGTQFRKIGLDGPTALGLLNQAVRAGARDSDIAADALKEFSIRTLEALETTDSKGRAQLTDLGQAFQNVLPPGADMYKVQERLAKGGKPAAKAFGQMVAGLKEIDDPATRSQTAVALFGTQAEDMGDALYAFDPSTAVAGLGKVEGASKKVDASTATAKNSITVFTRSLEQRLTAAGLKVLPTLVEVGGVLQDTFGPTLSEHAGLLTKVGLGLGAVAVGAKAVSVVASPLKGLYTGGKTAVSTIGKLRDGYKRFSAPGGGLDTVRLRAGQAGDGLKTVGSKARSGLGIAGRAIKTGATATVGLARSVTTSTIAWTRNTLSVARNRAAIIVQTVVSKAAAAATRGMAIAQRILNAALRANPIGVVITVLGLLVAGFVVAYKRSETFRRIVDGAMAGVRRGIGVMWRVVQPILGAFKGYLTNVLFPVVRFLWTRVVKPYFGFVGDRISGVWRNVISPAFDALRGGIGRVREGFKTGVDAIGRAWDGIRAKTRTPIKAVVGLINVGFIDPFNTISDKLGGPEVGRLKLPKGYATGGPVRGPGTATSDSILARLSNNEFVVRAKHAVKNMGLLKAINEGRVQDGLARFARGGPVTVKPLAGGVPSTYPGHTGVDFNAPNDYGKPVLAARAGRVSAVRRLRTSYGNHVWVRHASGLQTIYAHLSSIAAKVGQAVQAGTMVGRVGSTGNSSGPHLHFETRPGGSYSSAMAFLSGAKTVGGTGVPASLLGSLNPAALFSKAWAKVKGGVAALSNDGLVGEFVGGVVRRLRSSVPDFAKNLAAKVAEYSPLGLGKKLLTKVGLFDGGGIWQHGTGGMNLSGQPEVVFTTRQWSTISRAISQGVGGSVVGAGGEVQHTHRHVWDDDLGQFITETTTEVIDRRELAGSL